MINSRENLSKLFYDFIFLDKKNNLSYSTNIVLLQEYISLLVMCPIWKKKWKVEWIKFLYETCNGVRKRVVNGTRKIEGNACKCARTNFILSTMKQWHDRKTRETQVLIHCTWRSHNRDARQKLTVRLHNGSSPWFNPSQRQRRMSVFETAREVV